MPSHVQVQAIDGWGGTGIEDHSLWYEGLPGRIDVTFLKDYWIAWDGVEPNPAWRADPAWQPTNFVESDSAPFYLFPNDGHGFVGWGPVTQFCCVFEFTDTDVTFTNIALYLLCEEGDGAIIYLNGKEVFRRNLPPGPLTNGTYTGLPDGWFRYVRGHIDPALLRPLNVLAVEIYQNQPDSQRFAFDLFLMGEMPFREPRLTIERVDSETVRVSWDQTYWYSGGLEQAYEPGGEWFWDSWGPLTIYMVPGGENRYYRYRWRFSGD